MAPSCERYPRFCGNVIETPPASAMSHCHVDRLCTAVATATSEVEQAVTMLSAGPLRSSL